jgi:hypothetical protein
MLSHMVRIIKKVKKVNKIINNILLPYLVRTNIYNKKQLIRINMDNLYF